MKFKKRKVHTSDVYYDLFDGGYIKPSKMLADPAEAKAVEDAVGLVRRFLAEAVSADVLVFD